MKTVDDNAISPRSIRCTKAEYIYLTTILKQLRASDFNFKDARPQEPDETTIINSIPKDRFGVSVNEFMAKQGKAGLIIEDLPEQPKEEKDYSAWRNDKLMNEIFDSCLWEPTGENQCYPEGVEKYQRKYKDLWIKLNNAKRNNQSALCDEIMTEMMERIYNGK